MIKKFDSYNESVKDKMKPKTDEELNKIMNDYLLKTKDLPPIEKIFDIKEKRLDEYIDNKVIYNILNELSNKDITRFEKFVVINHCPGDASAVLFINLSNYKMALTDIEKQELVTKTLQKLL